jgi:hypothetical protein
MADHNFVKDRQDIAIWNAIDANNFKQALKLVDKRLAKKHTDYLEVRDDARLSSLICSSKPGGAQLT